MIKLKKRGHAEMKALGIIMMHVEYYLGNVTTAEAEALYELHDRYVQWIYEAVDLPKQKGDITRRRRLCRRIVKNLKAKPPEVKNIERNRLNNLMGVTEIYLENGCIWGETEEGSRLLAETASEIIYAYYLISLNGTYRGNQHLWAHRMYDLEVYNNAFD